MTDDLHLSKAEAQWAVALFYVAYVGRLFSTLILFGSSRCLLGHLRNAEHYLDAQGRTGVIPDAEYVRVGWHHHRHGLRLQRSRASRCPISACKYVALVAKGIAYVLRSLKGVAQSAFFPTIIIYISLWYRKGDHTMRIAIIYSAALLASALGSILVGVVRPCERCDTCRFSRRTASKIWTTCAACRVGNGCSSSKACRSSLLD